MDFRRNFPAYEEGLFNVVGLRGVFVFSHFEDRFLTRELKWDISEDVVEEYTMECVFSRDFGGYFGGFIRKKTFSKSNDNFTVSVDLSLLYSYR